MSMPIYLIVIITFIVLLLIVHGFHKLQHQIWINEEKIHMLELMVKSSNSEYPADPRGICWEYHHIDSDGNIIQKR